MRVSFIGSGNVASHLALACAKAKLSVIDIYSPSLSNAQALADQCGARAISDFSLLNQEVDLIIVAANDNALPSIAQQLALCSAPVVHTAGSVDVEVLRSAHHPYGVLYPLQTFSKNKEIEIAKVPFFAEASNEQLLMLLSQLVEQLGASFHRASSEQRLHLHIAAVFACNFSNYMYSLANDLLEKHQLPFEALSPLILETAEKIQHMSPVQAQTGPAKRNDDQTIEKHLQALANEPLMFQLYQLISTEIKKKQNL